MAFTDVKLIKLTQNLKLISWSSCNGPFDYFRTWHILHIKILMLRNHTYSHNNFTFEHIND